MIENNYYKWIIDSTEAMHQLKSTKLKFLRYEDLTYENYLVKALEGLKHKYERRQISDWYVFTSGKCDLTLPDFRKHFLGEINLHEHFLLFTDEGHREKWLFTLSVKDLDIFAEWYENFFNREFYEFSEYVLIFSNLNKIIYNDDEGGINEYVVL